VNESVGRDLSKVLEMGEVDYSPNLWKLINNP